jgi:peptidyl-prolyl cis-trans isomerase C
MFARAFIALFLIALLGPPATAQDKADAAKAAPAPADDPVVGRVNGYEIHRSDVAAQVERLPAQARQMPPDQLFPMMVEAIVNTHLIQGAAEKTDLADDPQVKARLAEAKDDIIRTAYLQRVVEKDMTDAKLHEHYEQFLKSAPPREEVNARHILVKTEDEAKGIIAQLQKGADFKKLAADKSTDPAGKESGGDLGWFTKDAMVPEFANAAFALKKGEYTKTPVKTRFGWHVILLVDRRTAPPPTFEEMKQQLASQVQNEILTKIVKELRTEAKIEVFGPDGKPVPQAAAAPTPAPAPAEAVASKPAAAPASAETPAPPTGTTPLPGLAPKK